jgi:hypothetical protein
MKMTLPARGAITTSPNIVRGQVSWASSVPDLSACSPGAKGIVFTRNLATGADSTGDPNGYVTVDAALVKIDVVRLRNDPNRPPTNSFVPLKLLFSTTDPDQAFVSRNVAPNAIIGGRSNLKMITTQ